MTKKKTSAEIPIEESVICCPSAARTKAGWCIILLTLCLGIYGFVSARRESNELRQNQKIIQATQNSDNYAAVVMDEKGNIIQWNVGMENLTGISKSQAQREGLSAIMCDPLKLEKHNKGMAAAFKDRSTYGKVIVVNCDIFDYRHEPIPVKVIVRMSQAEDGTVYAIARIDKESNVIEFGTNKALEHKIENEVEYRMERQMEAAKAAE